MEINDLISKIKQKKELSGIDNSIIKKTIEEYQEKNKLFIESLKEKELKIAIKDIRSKLRLYAGRFQSSLKDRLRLLEKNEVQKLLKTHFSTKERLDFYPKIKSIINSLNVKSILDLGCGLNPLAIASPQIKYYASDINAGELSLIEKFFKTNKIEGKTFVCNLTKIESCNLPNADICLIFKVLDILGKEQYIISEKILKSISSKYIFVSFSTRTLSGRIMKKRRRFWFENLLSKLNFSYKLFESENEIFYLASKTEKID